MQVTVNYNAFYVLMIVNDNKTDYLPTDISFANPFIHYWTTNYLKSLFKSGMLADYNVSLSVNYTVHVFLLTK